MNMRERRCKEGEVWEVGPLTLTILSVRGNRVHVRIDGLDRVQEEAVLLDISADIRLSYEHVSPPGQPDPR